MTDPRKAYYVYRARHPQGSDITLDEFTDIYRMGGRDALRSSSELIGLITLLRQLIWYLEASDEAAELIAEMDGGSPLWSER